MNREKYIPVWKDANKIESYSEKFFPASWDKIVTSNELLKVFLEENGWKFWDSCNVWENGFSITFEKYIDDVRLIFDFHWMDETTVYWWGRMRACFKYYPDDRCLCPIGHFEVDSITEKFMNVDTFSKLENNLVSAIKSQKTIQ